MIFYLILFGFPLLHLAWWGAFHLVTRALLRERRWRALPIAGHVFAVALLTAYVWTLAMRWSGADITPPVTLLAATYIWFLLALLPALLLTVIALLIAPRRRSRELRLQANEASSANTPPASDSTAFDPAPAGLTRREALAAGLASLTPIVALSSVTIAVPRLRDFRVRRIELPLQSLPAELDGLTIAHLSDSHVCKLSDERLIERIVRETNALQPDLALFTGDLIDFSLADLPAGLDMLQRIEPRYGRFLCEGNHDLFESRSAFEEQTRAAGVGLLLDEQAHFRIRGVDVQALGARWAGRVRRDADRVRRDSLGDTLALRDPDAFSMLLTHHPHDFDRAREAGVPLTLAGHTHGGQLMLTQNAGAGPMLFKYWSGLYRDPRSDAALVVSNGVGNWFPLRVNAPAEIIHLTLHRAV